MTQEVSELLKEALALPAEARAALAGSLLENLCHLQWPLSRWRSPFRAGGI
jgi:hypothetical protein